MEAQTLRRRIRCLLCFFVAALVASGLTAVPLTWEIDTLDRFLGKESSWARWWPEMSQWIAALHEGLHETDARCPFMFYGTDWLAFAHVVIAIAFVGPILDPTRNVWVIHWGMIACVLVIPTVLIFGPLRGIPPFWRWIDCSFGILGIVPLWITHNWVRRLTFLEQAGLSGEPPVSSPGA
jgi:hypothetical protein